MLIGAYYYVKVTTFIMERQIIFIPGLGDRQRPYQIVQPLWRHWGYETQVHAFGWDRPEGDFPSALAELEARVQRLSGRVALVGASAGGTAALHAGLRHPEKVDRIVTISSRLQNPELARTPVLRESIEGLAPLLAETDAQVLHDTTLSIYGRYDREVPPVYSQYEGMPQRRLPTIGHMPTIMAALTYLSPVIRSRLEE